MINITHKKINPIIEYGPLTETFIGTMYVGASHTSGIENPAGLELLLGFGGAIFDQVRIKTSLKKKKTKFNEVAKKQAREKVQEKLEELTKVSKIPEFPLNKKEFNDIYSDAELYAKAIKNEFYNKHKIEFEKIAYRFENNYHNFLNNQNSFSIGQKQQIEGNTNKVIATNIRRDTLYHMITEEIDAFNGRIKNASTSSLKQFYKILSIYNETQGLFTEKQKETINQKSKESTEYIKAQLNEVINENAQTIKSSGKKVAYIGSTVLHGVVGGSGYLIGRGIGKIIK